MLKNKTLVLLALITVAGLAYVIVQNNQAEDSFDSAGQAVVPGLQERLDDVAKVQIATADKDPLVTLQRQAESTTEASWVVAEKANYPADVKHLRSALRALAGAKILEPMTSNPQYFDRLGLRDLNNAESAAVALRTFNAEGERLGSLLLGSTAERAGETVTYVRRPGENQSWLVSGSIALRNDPSEWLVKDIISVPREDIQKVRIEHWDGSVLTAVRTADAPNQLTVQNVPADRELTYASIGNSLLQPLMNLQLEDVKPYTDAAFAEQKTTRSLFTRADGSVIAVKSFAADDGKRWAQLRVEFVVPAVAEASDDAAADAEPDLAAAMEAARQLNARLSPWMFEIQAFHYQTLTKRMDDLLVALPEESEPSASDDDTGAAATDTAE